LVIVRQISSEIRRNRSLTLSQDSRPWNRVPAAKNQDSGKNLVNTKFGVQEHKVKILGALESSSGTFRPTLTTAKSC